MGGVNRRLRDLGQGMIDSTWKANEDFFHEVILDQIVNDEKHLPYRKSQSCSST